MTSASETFAPEVPDPAEPVELDSGGGGRLYAQTETLRATAPAVRVRLPEDLLAWSVTRGDVVRRLLTHPHVRKDARRNWPGYEPGAISWLYPWVDSQSMFTSDAADHARLRNLIGRAFAPRRIEALRPAVRTIVTDLLDALAARATGAGAPPVDLRADYAYAIPTRVICDLFGVPEEQRPAMLAAMDLVLTTDPAAVNAGEVSAEVIAHMRVLVETRRDDPGDDMTSLLLAAHEADGDRLTEHELISTLFLMVGAGSQTTAALLDHAVRELLTHRDQLVAVLAEPARWDDVVEEALRLHPPIVHMPLRFATGDIDLGEGVTIRSGEAIIVGFGAHGRDPAVHDDPAAFDIDRADKAHLAFGHGIHYCLGASLARLEAQIALPALFDRFPDLALAVPPSELRHQSSFIGNDVLALPVHLGSPAAP
ncbi:cytochrome P450 [Streptomyces sp. B6B3]|uniref:cytochrome P450 family protein n=1 Tax=Streptomyces sp. B6B3 TaxID=3153570 RepID=UPI00325DBD58